MKFVKGMEFTSDTLGCKYNIWVLSSDGGLVVYGYPNHHFDLINNYKRDYTGFGLFLKSNGYKLCKSSIIKLFFEQ